jgi:hypothetical protein
MKGQSFLLIAVLLVVTDLVVPYAFLGDVTTFAGTFLFWCVLTLAVIIAAAFYTRRWSDE